MSKELLEVFQANPDLPIYAWVDGEVYEDSCGYWLGKFTSASVREYVILDFGYGYYDTSWVFKDDNEDFVDWFINEDDFCKGLTLEESEAKAQEYLDSLEYKKAIFVFISTL